MEPELLEFGQLGQLANGLVSNLGCSEVKVFEIGEFSEIWSTGVSDGVPSQAKVGQLLHLGQMGNAWISDLGGPNWEQLDGWVC